MIPNYKASCKKIHLDFIDTSYDTMHEQLLKAPNGALLCVFCKNGLQSHGIKTSYNPNFACSTCNYSLHFGNKYDAKTPGKLRCIQYMGNTLYVTERKDHNKIILTYVGKHSNNNFNFQTENGWFTLSDILNDINQINRRTECMNKARNHNDPGLQNELH